MFRTENENSHIRLTTCVVLRMAMLGLGLAWGHSAEAIELFNVVPLPDQGFGSTAVAADTINWQGEERAVVVGSVADETGMQVATSWKMITGWDDATGHFDVLGEPGQAGSATDVAMRVVEGEAGPILQTLVVGSVVDGASQDIGSLNFLREDASGNVTAVQIQLPTLGGTQSRAMGLNLPETTSIDDALPELSAFAVGSAQLPNGNSHAVLWQVKLGPLEDGDYDAVVRDLGTLGGPNSEAVSISVDESTGKIAVGGTSQTSGGKKVAAIWFCDYIWALEGPPQIIGLPTPQDGESEVTALEVAASDPDNGDVFFMVAAVGTVTNKSGVRPVLWQVDADGSVAVELGELQGTDRTEPLAIDGYQGELPGEYVVALAGTALTQDTGAQEAWISFGYTDPVQPLVETFAYARAHAADSLGFDWSGGLLSLNDIDAAGFIVGQARSPETFGHDFAQAVALAATDIQVPQHYAVTFGKASEQSVTSVWHDDGEGISVGSEHLDKGRGLSIEFVAQPLRGPESLDCPDLHLVTNVMTRFGGAADWTQTVSMWDDSIGEWVEISQDAIQREPTALSWVTNQSCGGSTAPTGGARVRIEVDSKLKANWGIFVERLYFE